MHDQLAVPKSFELYVPDLDNHILVENTVNGVVIRASRDNFSDRRKSSFIRQLAAEGYIPDHHEWFCDPEQDGLSGVKWITQFAASKNLARLRFPGRLCTRRNAVYGSLFVGWLIVFIWVLRHMRHGLGV